MTTSDERRFDLVTLLTDYGWSGGFVGALHAVVDRLGGGRVRALDLDHEIPAHDVLLGALRLERLLPYTRPAVHVVVVDPGVGSDRLGIAVEAGGRVFVGPDNGVLGFAVERAGGIDRAVSLERTEWFWPERSATFDGRDVFAPVATHLALGVDLGELGDELAPESLVQLERARGPVVVQVDGFGNVQLGLEAGDLPDLGSLVEVHAPDGRTRKAVAGASFSDAPLGGLVLLVDSDGALALSVNQGRASDVLGVRRGDRLELLG